MNISSLLIFVPFLAFGQINVGPAINNLNSRVTAIENTPPITSNEIASMGFLTNELDRTALGIIDVYTNYQNSVVSNLDSQIAGIQDGLHDYDKTRTVLPYQTSLSVYSNTLYTASSEPDGIVFSQPVGYTNKESRITLHLYKGSSSVTWFTNVTWIYGSMPEWQITNKTYVIQFESKDGNRWNGWIEYLY